MAQKTGKEETDFKVPDTLTLCVNNCGVTGNPATNNMCQKCFNATTASPSTSPASTSATAPAPSGGPSLKFSGEPSPRSAPSRSPESRSDAAAANTTSTATTTTTSSGKRLASDRSESAAVPVAEKISINRCSGCRKRVGLTGFRCRCGELFCADHRYSDRHNCSYDYKAAGREAIARENPVVKAAKILKV